MIFISNPILSQRVLRRLKATLPDSSALDVISLDSLKIGVLRILGRHGKGSFVPTGAVRENTLLASQRDGKTKALSNRARDTKCATGHVSTSA